MNIVEIKELDFTTYTHNHDKLFDIWDHLQLVVLARGSAYIPRKLLYYRQKYKCPLRGQNDPYERTRDYNLKCYFIFETNKLK